MQCSGAVYFSMLCWRPSEDREDVWIGERGINKQEALYIKCGNGKLCTGCSSVFRVSRSGYLHQKLPSSMTSYLGIGWCGTGFYSSFCVPFLSIVLSKTCITLWEYSPATDRIWKCQLFLDWCFLFSVLSHRHLNGRFNLSPAKGRHLTSPFSQYLLL